MNKAFMNWSGGKDSSLCLHRVLQQQQYKVDCLLTNINTVQDRISMHGVRRDLLIAQAGSIGIPLQTIELPEQPDMSEYDQKTQEKMVALKDSGYTHALFGDIFLEDLRQYREDRVNSLGLHGVFPLWKVDTTQLLKDFIRSGFKAIIVCINESRLDRSFCGRLIDESLLQDLPGNVDPCGENGEFHSFVFDGPIFKSPINYKKGEIAYRQYRTPANPSAAGNGAQPDPQSRTGFFFCDLLPDK